jgi:hypothetical protein
MTLTEEKVASVTGAPRGIGAEVVKAFPRPTRAFSLARGTRYREAELAGDIADAVMLLAGTGFVMREIAYSKAARVRPTARATKGVRGDHHWYRDLPAARPI